VANREGTIVLEHQQLPRWRTRPKGIEKGSVAGGLRKDVSARLRRSVLTEGERSLVLKGTLT